MGLDLEMPNWSCRRTVAIACGNLPLIRPATLCAEVQAAAASTRRYVDAAAPDVNIARGPICGPGQGSVIRPFKRRGAITWVGIGGDSRRLLGSHIEIELTTVGSIVTGHFNVVRGSGIGIEGY